MVGNIHENDRAQFSLSDFDPVQVDQLLGMRAQIKEIAWVLAREKKGLVPSLLLDTPITDKDAEPSKV